MTTAVAPVGFCGDHGGGTGRVCGDHSSGPGRVCGDHSSGSRWLRSYVAPVGAPAVSAVTNPSAGTPVGSPLGVSPRSSSEPSSQAAVGPPTGSERSAALPGPGGLEVGLTSLAASPSGARNQSEGTSVGSSGAASGLLPGGDPVKSPSVPFRCRLLGRGSPVARSSAGLTGGTQLFSRAAAASTPDALGWRRAPHDRADYRSFRYPPHPRSPRLETPSASTRHARVRARRSPSLALTERRRVAAGREPATSGSASDGSQPTSRSPGDAGYEEPELTGAPGSSTGILRSSIPGTTPPGSRFLRARLATGERGAKSGENSGVATDVGRTVTCACRKSTRLE